MRVPLSWLAEIIDLPPPEALEERLLLGGLEVEAVERTGPDLAGVRVGEVLDCERHPNADRLSLCRVDTGEGAPVPIVCGAPNVAAGQKVAVARPGVRLPDGRRLERARIRGVVSEGMLCSARELGLGEDAGGILVLPSETAVGESLERVLGTGDQVLEIALTPNRGDCASVLGVAREVRAHFGGELRMPECEPVENGAPAAESVRVAVEDGGGCAHYVARVVRGVRVGESPGWMRRRLEAAGMRAINVVVDVTNWVMLELGQPLHGFDLGTLRGGRIVVRGAQPGEKIATLDGQTRALDPDDLVIADAERPIAIAGVMGGVETEVSEQTTDVLLESALFVPGRVRRTARRLGLSTEASYRFERGVDREGVRRAADRAARLLAELAGGRVAPGAVEAGGERLPFADTIALDPSRVERLLGVALGTDAVIALLDRVDVAAQVGRHGDLLCRVPSHRNDIAREVDLIEEVARIHGYDRIPVSLPLAPLAPVEEPADRALTRTVRDTLRGLGWVECMTLPFESAEEADRLRLAPDDPRRRRVRVRNPLVEEEGALRSTLVASLLRRVASNRSRQVDRVRLFEVARSFRAVAAGGLPEERLELTAVLAPGEEPRLWERPGAIPLVLEAKGVAERLVLEIGRGGRLVPAEAEPFLHPRAALAVEAEGAPGARQGSVRLGAVGELHPEVAAQYGVEGPCAVLWLDLDGLAGRPAARPHFREVPRFPRVRRDLAVLLPRELGAEEVLAAIREAAGPHLVSVELFDRYEGAGVAKGRVSLAFRLVFQRPDRTLRDAEVVRAIDRVVAALGERFGGELR